MHATAHSPAHYKPMACADLDEVTVHQKKVSGKHMQARAEPPAGCSAVWLPPEAMSTALQQHLLVGRTPQW